MTNVSQKTYISRKDVFDLLERMCAEEATNEAEEKLLKLFASEILRLETVELEEDNNNDKRREDYKGFF